LCSNTLFIDVSNELNRTTNDWSAPMCETYAITSFTPSIPQHPSPAGNPITTSATQRTIEVGR